MIDYTALSAQTLRRISYYEERKVQLIKNDNLSRMFEAFSKDEFGSTVYSYSDTDRYYPTLSVTVDSASTVVRVLKWFREEGYKVNTFKDYEGAYTPFREYNLIERDSDNTSIVFAISAYFEGGTCEFVDEPTGEIEEVPEVVAVPAHKRQVMRKVLKCGTEELPSAV